MTRIGFAYNQKPEVPALRLEDGAEDARPDEEPPSNSHTDWSSAPDAAASSRGGGVAAANVDDEFAEWDSAETINAVEQALKRVVLHRKNALFFRTEQGSAVGDLLMSMIETCRANGIRAAEYLVQVMKNARAVRDNPAQ